MHRRSNKLLASRILLRSIVLSCVLGLAAIAAPQSKPAPQTKPKASETQQRTSKAFATPNQAADELIRAAGQFDVAALKEIIGPDAADLVETADKVQDKERASNFAAKAQEKTEVT